MLSKLRIFSYLLWIVLISIFINIAWSYLGTTLSQQIHTLGLIIQLLGIVSASFSVMSSQKLAKYAGILDDAIEQGIDTLMLQPLVSHAEHPQSYSIIVSIKLLIFSICNLTVYLATQYLEIDSLWLFILLFGLLLLYLYIWAWSFLIILVFRVLHKNEPAFLGKIFETSDYGLSMIAVIVFLLFFVSVSDLMTWLSKAKTTEKIAGITLPLILAGTVLQLLAAFLF